jgi:hypothetical protein
VARERLGSALGTFFETLGPALQYREGRTLQDQDQGRGVVDRALQQARDSGVWDLDELKQIAVTAGAAHSDYARDYGESVFEAYAPSLGQRERAVTDALTAGMGSADVHRIAAQFGIDPAGSRPFGFEEFGVLPDPRPREDQWASDSPMSRLLEVPDALALQQWQLNAQQATGAFDPKNRFNEVVVEGYGNVPVTQTPILDKPGHIEVRVSAIAPLDVSRIDHLMMLMQRMNMTPEQQTEAVRNFQRDGRTLPAGIDRETFEESYQGSGIDAAKQIEGDAPGLATDEGPEAAPGPTGPTLAPGTLLYTQTPEGIVYPQAQEAGPGGAVAPEVAPEISPQERTAFHDEIQGIFPDEGFGTFTPNTDPNSQATQPFFYKPPQPQIPFEEGWATAAPETLLTTEEYQEVVLGQLDAYKTGLEEKLVELQQDMADAQARGDSGRNTELVLDIKAAEETLEKIAALEARAAEMGWGIGPAPAETPPPQSLHTGEVVERAHPDPVTGGFNTRRPDPGIPGQLDMQPQQIPSTQLPLGTLMPPPPFNFPETPPESRPPAEIPGVVRRLGPWRLPGGALTQPPPYPGPPAIPRLSPETLPGGALTQPGPYPGSPIPRGDAPGGSGGPPVLWARPPIESLPPDRPRPGLTAPPPLPPSLMTPPAQRGPMATLTPPEPAPPHLAFPPPRQLGTDPVGPPLTQPLRIAGLPGIRRRGEAAPPEIPRFEGAPDLQPPPPFPEAPDRPPVARPPVPPIAPDQTWTPGSIPDPSLFGPDRIGRTAPPLPPRRVQEDDTLRGDALPDEGQARTDQIIEQLRNSPMGKKILGAVQNWQDKEEGAHVTAEEVLSWAPIVFDHANSQGFDPNLIWTIIQTESTFNKLSRAENPDGDAIGLMQLREGAAKDVGGEILEGWPGSALDPKLNIEAGIDYLAKVRGYIDQAGINPTIPLILGAYHAGWSGLRGALGPDILQNSPDDVEKIEAQLEDAGRPLTAEYIRGIMDQWGGVSRRRLSAN